MNEYYYDDAGNRTKLVHMNAVYSKDGNGRIDSMTAKASESDQGLTKTYYYANFTELTKMTASEYGGTTRDYTYEHDNAGRLTRQVQNVFSPNSTTTFNYEWDALDRMTKVQRVASGVTKTINYTYNAAGQRVRRVDTSTNVTKLWTYAGNNIASVSTKSGGCYGSDDYVYTVGPAVINNVTERHKLNGSGTDSRYYQYDHRGNVAAVSDASGRILRGYQYDAFGNIAFSFQTGQSGAATNDGDILFTGKDLDPDTGLYYFNAGWYDNEIGRFSSASHLRRDLEHPYLLCKNNPIRWVDPSGLWGFEVEGGWVFGGRLVFGSVCGNLYWGFGLGFGFGLSASLSRGTPEAPTVVPNSSGAVYEIDANVSIGVPGLGVEFGTEAYAGEADPGGYKTNRHNYFNPTIGFGRGARLGAAGTVTPIGGVFWW